IARQVAEALGYAHGRGIVHRDVKPDNVLLDGSGHVLVTDFGIAKAAQEASVSQLTTEGMVVGTPHYMSPEQATGERVDGRSDIYALGVVLYQMLAGTPPFEGESAQSVLMKQATVNPVPIRELRGDVPAALAGVIERMLAKDPADRYQTADEPSQALIASLPAAGCRGHEAGQVLRSERDPEGESGAPKRAVRVEAREQSHGGTGCCSQAGPQAEGIAQHAPRGEPAVGRNRRARLEQPQRRARHV